MSTTSTCRILVRLTCRPTGAASPGLDQRCIHADGSGASNTVRMAHRARELRQGHRRGGVTPGDSAPGELKRALVSSKPCDYRLGNSLRAFLAVHHAHTKLRSRAKVPTDLNVPDVARILGRWCRASILESNPDLCQAAANVRG